MSKTTQTNENRLMIRGYFARLRWWLFCKFSALFLGRKRFEMFLGWNVVDYMASGIQLRHLRESIVKRFEIAAAEIVQYRFPEGNPSWFPAATAFDRKLGYILSNARLLPKCGAVFLDHGMFLEESMTSMDIFANFGMTESMLPTITLNETCPVFPFATCFVYYHELVEVMTAALQARAHVSGLKLLLHPDRPEYVDEMLAFFNFERDEIIESHLPVLVSSCAMIPHIHQRSFASRSDLIFLRNSIMDHLGNHKSVNNIYISRKKANSRRLVNEEELEQRLAKAGYISVCFEDLPFAKQLETIQTAKSIVAPHGSGLANLVAAQPGTKVCEILSPEWPRSTFARLSKELDLEYGYVAAIRTNSGDLAPIETILAQVS